MTDNDRDVAHAARNLHAIFKRTPLRMTGGAGLLDINGSSSGAGGRRSFLCMGTILAKKLPSAWVATASFSGWRSEL